jgi:hypothetical protein
MTGSDDERTQSDRDGSRAAESISIVNVCSSSRSLRKPPVRPRPSLAIRPSIKVGATRGRALGDEPRREDRRSSREKRGRGEATTYAALKRGTRTNELVVETKVCGGSWPAPYGFSHAGDLRRSRSPEKIATDRVQMRAHRSPRCLGVSAHQC